MAIETTVSTPATQLVVRRARRADRLAVRNLLELYQHDLSEYWPYELDAHGLYGYHSLDYYWREADHAAYVFLVDNRYAGFALINADVCIPGNEHWMAQFFVARRYRRRGVGQAAARSLFDQRPGLWEVGQLPNNLPARDFWLHVIGAYTGGRFTDQFVQDGEWAGQVQCFDNRAYATAGTAGDEDPASTF